MSRKLLLPLVAAAALALPAAAAAHGRWHHHHGHVRVAVYAQRHVHKVLFARLTGTGTDLAGATTATANGSIASSTLGTGTFAATITTDWTSAKTWTGRKGTSSCAPATASLTLVGATTTNTTVADLTGKTCRWTPAGSTAAAGAMFIGKDASVTGAGSVASLTGRTEKAFLWERNGTVEGAVFASASVMTPIVRTFAETQHVFAVRTGRCDDDHDGH